MEPGLEIARQVPGRLHRSAVRHLCRRLSFH
jgi:hypothetical protein